MTSEGHPTPRSPRDDSTGGSADRPAAAADLLQMWVGGGAPATTDEPPAADAPPAPSEESDDAPAALWPESDAAPDPSADTPGADAEWWPYDEQAADEAAQQEPVLEEPVAEEPAAEEPAQVADVEPAPAAPADNPVEALWDDAVESEWSEPAPELAPAPVEEPAAVETSTDVAADADDTAPAAVEEPRERGWASFGAAQTAEDVLDQIGREDGWSQTPAAPVEAQSVEETVAEPEPASVEPPAAEPTPIRSRQGLDLSATTHWSLDDFESYIREQGSNELAGWMAGPPADTPPAATAEPEPEPVPAAIPEPEPEPILEPEPEPEPEQVSLAEPAGEQTVAWTPVEPLPPLEPAESAGPGEEPAADPGADPAADDLGEPAAPPRMRGLLAKMGLAREQEPEVADEPAAQQPAAADTWGEPDDVAWEQPPAEAPDQLFAVPEPEPTAPAAAVQESDWDPDATQYFDWTLHDVDQADPSAEAAAPAVAGPEDVALPTTAPVGAESSVAAAEPETATETATETAPEADDQDYQEWYDDQGLRWVSTDGGYTWFSDDGQGWNAEVGEPIDVPAAAAAAPAPAASATTPAEQAAPAAPDDDVWPTSPADDATTAQPTPEFWPEPDAAEPAAATTSAPTTAPTTGEPPASDDAYASLYAGPPAAAAASVAPKTPGAAATGTGSEEIPPFVEYKPRGAYRPILGVLFVAAAILAVVAIFWAVSKGSQAATGIAAGVTGFALAFWWGLLSWTPTVVSLSGSVLEVARGSDGERFDLRSPKLVIDVDDDIDSRNWRTTITRPNGTELVIPASAVDPEEFSRIVRHYRAEVSAPGR